MFVGCVDMCGVSTAAPGGRRFRESRNGRGENWVVNDSTKSCCRKGSCTPGDSVTVSSLTDSRTSGTLESDKFGRDGGKGIHILLLVDPPICSHEFCY